MPVDHFANAVADTSVDERVLLQRVSAGDRSALKNLHHRYYQRLARFLWRSIGRTDGVDRIINDTFMEVWAGECHPREASLAVSTWLFGVAYRKAQHSRDQIFDPVKDADISDGLRHGFGTLSFELRSTLTLAYQVCCTLEEIAAITGVPVESVKARMRCAREKLRCASRQGLSSSGSNARTLCRGTHLA
jgi:RNA polymerase sigma-70 factor, ECF subfamily